MIISQYIQKNKVYLSIYKKRAQKDIIAYSFLPAKCDKRAENVTLLLNFFPNNEKISSPTLEDPFKPATLRANKVYKRTKIRFRVPYIIRRSPFLFLILLLRRVIPPRKFMAWPRISTTDNGYLIFLFRKVSSERRSSRHSANSSRIRRTESRASRSFRRFRRKILTNHVSGKSFCRIPRNAVRFAYVLSTKQMNHQNSR